MTNPIVELCARKVETQPISLEIGMALSGDSLKLVIQEMIRIYAAAIRAIPEFEIAAVAGEPVAWMYRVNNTHDCFCDIKPPEDAYDEGTLIPLYASPVVPGA